MRILLRLDLSKNLEIYCKIGLNIVFRYFIERLYYGKRSKCK